MTKIFRLSENWKLQDITHTKKIQDSTIEEALWKINNPFLDQVWDFVWNIINLPSSYGIKWPVLVKSSTFWITVVQRASVKDFEKKVKSPLEYHEYKWLLSKNSSLSWLELTFEAKILEECVKKWVPITREIIECLRKWKVWKLRELLSFDFDHLLTNVLNQINNIKDPNNWNQFLTDEWFYEN